MPPANQRRAGCEVCGPFGPGTCLPSKAVTISRSQLPCTQTARWPSSASTSIFTLDGGLLLTLYERTNLAKDASLPAGPPSSTEFSLGIPAQSQAEVDRLLVQVEAAGGTLTAPAHMRPFGVYSGYFTDPDGHLFEIAWNSNE